MRPTILAMLVALALPASALATPPAPQHPATPAYVTAAIGDTARQADQADDTRRKVAAVMTFAEVKPGQKVLELIPGSGYWTRVFSAIVGPSGHVYTVWPDEMAKFSAESFDKLSLQAKQPHYANISLLKQPAAKLASPVPVDLVFTSQNYHDYPDPFMGSADPVLLDRQAFAALKPGGLFVIIDHAAAAGSGMRDTDTLHRIDPAIVKMQVESVGFVFDGESDALRNPADSHTLKVFDKAIRGHTDQFIYRFRKPAH